MAASPDSGTGTEESSALPAFEIDISEQGWITSDGEAGDLCSHGDIRLVIGGRVICPGNGSGAYTISTSALALLRTIESDHVSGDVTNQLILHCGMILMTSCPIGVDWSVSHADGRVRLSEVVRRLPTEEFPHLAVELSEEDYCRQLVAFAEKANRPFVGVKKVFADEFERQLYDDFWHEYEARLVRAATRSTDEFADSR